MSSKYKLFGIFTVCVTVVSALIYWFSFSRSDIFNRKPDEEPGHAQYQQYDYPYSFTYSSNVSPVTLTHLLDPNRQPKPHIVVQNRGQSPALVLYSARYDSSLQSVVLVGYFNKRIGPLPKVFCRLESPSHQAQQASHHGMHEGHDRTYDGVLFFCPANNWKPTSQSLVHVKAEHSRAAAGSVVLPVQFAKSGQLRSSAAACITALRYVSSQEPEARLVLRLVEFIEVNRLLGIEHFYFYNWSLPLGVSRTLIHYAGLGLVTIHQWSLPSGIHPENDIHYFGQMSASNDCLYAARDQYRLVAFIDIDEFLVPLGGSAGTVVEAARRYGLTDAGGGGPCALGFRHGVFPLMSDAKMANTTNWKRMPSGLKGCYVTTMLYDQRAQEVMEFTIRSKLLVVARQIKEIGIHFVWDTWTGCQTKQLNPDTEGLLHHMRSWGPVKLLVRDTSMQKYNKSIEAAIVGARLRLKKLLGFDICSK